MKRRRRRTDKKDPKPKEPLERIFSDEIAELVKEMHDPYWSWRFINKSQRSQ